MAFFFIKLGFFIFFAYILTKGMGECMQNENEVIVKHLSRIYKKLKQEYFDVDHLMVCEGEYQEAIEAFEFIETIDAILDAMDYDEALILRNDYFNHREAKWFMNYYSKSTYYRIRSRAIDEFVRCVTA